MRASEQYISEITSLAEDCVDGSAPSFEIENCAAQIAAAHGLSNVDVMADVADIERKLRG